MQAPETQVVRIRRSNKEGVVQGCDFYIGRRQNQGGWNLEDSPFHNPYPVKKYGFSESMRLFRVHLNELIKNDPENYIMGLYHLSGKKLGCWCKPKGCHGDILKEYADHIKLLYDQDMANRDGNYTNINNFIRNL